MAFTSPGNIPAPWPYVVTNPFDLAHFRWFMERFGSSVRVVLYDSGVGVFRSGGYGGSYPPGYLRRFINGLREVEGVLERHAPSAVLYYVIPDVPGEYAPYPLNVARTLEYIRLFRRLAPWLPGTPVPVVQGGEGQPGSLVRSYLSHREVYDEFEVVALGRVSGRPRVIAKSIAVFDQVASRPFHAFGTPLRALRYLRAWGLAGCRLASIDTPTYIFDILYRNGPGKTRGDMARILLERMSLVQRELDEIPCNPGLTAWLDPADAPA